MVWDGSLKKKNTPKTRVLLRERHSNRIFVANMVTIVYIDILN